MHSRYIYRPPCLRMPQHPRNPQSVPHNPQGSAVCSCQVLHEDAVSALDRRSCSPEAFHQFHIRSSCPTDSHRQIRTHSHSTSPVRQSLRSARQSYCRNLCPCRRLQCTGTLFYLSPAPDGCIRCNCLSDNAYLKTKSELPFQTPHHSLLMSCGD